MGGAHVMLSCREDLLPVCKKLTFVNSTTILLFYWIWIIKILKFYWKERTKVGKGRGSILWAEVQEPSAEGQEKQIPQLTIFIKWILISISD